MTREEILAQAKIGGFAIVKIQIDRSLVENVGVAPFAGMLGGARVYCFCEEVVAIEPPPETIEQENARLKARNAELERMIAIRQGMVPF